MKKHLFIIIFLLINLQSFSQINEFNIQKTIYEKESKVKINLDSMNWGEIASKNNEAHRIWQQLSQCSNSQDPRQFYFQYDFSDCPRLEDEINSYRKRMLNFLINTKYRSMDISTYDDSFFEVEDRIMNSSTRKTVQAAE